MRKPGFGALFFSSFLLSVLLMAWPIPAKGASGAITFAMSQRGVSNIYLVNPDGSHLRRIISNGHDPSFTPGTRTITFVRDNDIYQANMDGSRVQRVINVPAGLSVSNPAFSEDKSLIVYAATPNTRGATTDLHLYRTDGSGERVIKNGLDPSFTPDQVVIIFARGNAIFNVSRSMMSEHPFTPNQYYKPKVNGMVRYPVYGSGTFSGVVFNIRPTKGTTWNIRAVLYGRQGQREVSLATNATQPAFSMDGNYIAFVRKGDLYIMRANGTHQTRIVRGPGTVSHPSWWMAGNF